MKRCASVAAAMISMALFLPQAHAHQWQARIDQGDVVLNENNAACTVGYIDKKNNRAYLADHCVTPNTTASVFNEDGVELGYIVSKSDFESEANYLTSRRDANFITLHEGIFAGENIYSGDNRIRTKDVAIGDQLCAFRHKSKTVGCGKVVGVDGTLIEGNSGVAGGSGDSGGPAWIPGKGFVGVHSIGISTKKEKNKRTVFVSIDDKNCSLNNNMDNKNNQNDPSICPHAVLADHSPDAAGNGMGGSQIIDLGGEVRGASYGDSGMSHKVATDRQRDDVVLLSMIQGLKNKINGFLR